MSAEVSINLSTCFFVFFGRVIGQVYSSLVADRGGIGLMPGQTMLLAGMSRVWGF